ncbi:MAG: hypothetical protein M0P12_01040 [Paludibacteraceae bacterium]|nr:hypothetical protein [Paludibacteraceae bacterium]
MNFIQKINELKPDFSWMEENDSYDVKKNERNPFDCKDELEKQWNGDFIPSSEPEGSMKMMRNAKQKIIQSVRNMMNAGCKIDVIKSRISQNNKKEIVALFKPDIEKQLKLYGSVGRFILDARGYNSCKEAFESAVKNPYRKHFGYVLGCSCKEHAKINRMPKTENLDFKIKEGPMDMVASCLNDDYVKKEYFACIPTSLVLIAGAGDIDEKWAGDTMIDVMNAGFDNKDGNEDVIKKITASCDKPYDRLKKFFLAFENGINVEEKFEANPEDIFTTTSQDVEIPEIEVKTPEIEIPVRSDNISLRDDLETVELEDMENNQMGIKLFEDAENIPVSEGAATSIEIDVSEENSSLEGIGNVDVDMGFSSPDEINIPESEGNLQVGFSEGFSEDIKIPEEEDFEIQF